MIINTEGKEVYAVRDFIAADWDMVVNHLQNPGVSAIHAEDEAKRIYEAIGGEEE